MKTNNLILNLFLPVLFSASAILSGCKKDDSTATASDITTHAVEFETSEQISNDIDEMTDEAFVTGSVSMRLSEPGSGNSILGCATVTNDTINHILTIDFGIGCTGFDGRTRSGQVIIAYNGHYFDPGFSRAISFNNYFVNNNQVTGTRSITNNGLNGNGNLTWTISAVNLRITRPNGYYQDWNSTRIREMIAGFTTANFVNDDVYLVTGSGVFTNSQGNSVNFTIINPLRKEISCRWIVSGTVEVTPSNHPVRTLDYGSGACDHFATVTLNGVTRNIILH